MDLRHKIGLELNRHLAKELTKDHPLREIFWECTLRCNLHCRHCGSDCKALSGLRDMPLEDFLKVLKSVKDAGEDTHQIMVVVTGGEPLMRPDLERCGRAFYEMEFPWGMVTNGYALTAEKLRRLMAAGLRSMTVSLDGLEVSHDWLRCVPGSFSRAAAAIRLACGTPDLVFDVRFLKNPYYDVNLRKFTGLDPEIRSFVEACPESGVFLDKLEDMLEFLIPNYVKEGKNQLVVSIGCTGGRHRSVALAEAIYERLKGSTDYGLKVEHRDMDRDLVRKRTDYEVK